MPTQLASQTARLPGDGKECDTTTINDYKSCIVKAMEIRFGLGSTGKVAQITNSERKIYTYFSATDMSLFIPGKAFRAQTSFWLS